MIEGIIVGIVVLAAAVYVARKLWASSQGEKGTCRSCGDTCGCAIKDATGKKERP